MTATGSPIERDRPVRRAVFLVAVLNLGYFGLGILALNLDAARQVYSAAREERRSALV